MDEVSTWQFSEERFLRIFAVHALKLLYFDIQFFALDYIPSIIFRKIRRINACKKIIESLISGQFHPYKSLICIEFFLGFSIFALFPLFLICWFANKGMFYMLSSVETALAQGDILTRDAFIHSAFLVDFLKLTAITIVVIAYTYFLAVNAFLHFVLFSFN
jgi:hypothetical protein